MRNAQSVLHSWDKRQRKKDEKECLKNIGICQHLFHFAKHNSLGVLFKKKMGVIHFYIFKFFVSYFN